MSLPTPQSPTHAAPRLTLARFTALLKSKNSPATAEAAAIWAVLLEEGIDPSFALAQFRVESQYGTSGWAKETGSLGNMLYDSNLTILSGPPKTFYTSSGHKYTFATYTNYADAARDYARYIHWYRDRHGLETIYEATGRWLGLSRTGDAGHLSYVNIIISDMISYEITDGEFYEAGDKMIQGKYIDKGNGRIAKRIFVKTGTDLYRGTNGDWLKKLAPATGIPGLNLLFLGLAQGSKDWGAVVVGIPSIDDGAGTVVYIKQPDLTTVTAA